MKGNLINKVVNANMNYDYIYKPWHILKNYSVYPINDTYQKFKSANVMYNHQINDVNIVLFLIKIANYKLV